jgi:hypothetical protein
VVKSDDLFAAIGGSGGAIGSWLGGGWCGGDEVSATTPMELPAMAEVWSQRLSSNTQVNVIRVVPSYRQVDVTRFWPCELCHCADMKLTVLFVRKGKVVSMRLPEAACVMEY